MADPDMGTGAPRPCDARSPTKYGVEGRAWRIPAVIIAVTSLCRVLIAASTGLGIDESYWASLSRFPSLSYVDDAPLQAWIVWATRVLSGSEAPVVLRMPFILLFAGSSYFMYRLSARLFGARAGLWAVVAFALAPVFTLADGVWILPDGPLIFFALATANVLASILLVEGDTSPNTAKWLLAGLLGGLALLAKYHAVFLFLATLAFLATIPQQRWRLLSPGPWLGALVALAVFSPVLVWNIEHDWAALAFQSDRLGSAPSSRPWVGTGRMLAGAVLLLGWLVVPLGYCLVRALWRGPEEPEAWFLSLLAIGPIAVFGTVSVWAHQHFPHWPMPGWLFAFPLLGSLWARLESRRPNIARYSMLGSALVLGAGIAILVAHVRSNVLAPLLHAGGDAPDPTVELIDWHALRTELQARQLLDGRTPGVATLHWTDAAKAAYALGPTIPVICVCRVPQHFPYLYPPKAFEGHDLIVVGSRLLERRKHQLAQSFDRLEPLEPVRLVRAGTVVKSLPMYRGVRFHLATEFRGADRR